MYLGSVKFFKHLILGVLSLIILLLSLLIYDFIHFISGSDKTFQSTDISTLNAATDSTFVCSDVPAAETDAPMQVTDGQSNETQVFIEDNRAVETDVSESITDTTGVNDTQETASDTNPSYQALYPDLFCADTNETVEQSNVVYLTFDDGPSQQTMKILDILKENNVKATFFVIGKTDVKSKEIMKQIVDDGNAIGVHSYTHIYKEIYSSVDDYLKDFYDDYNLIYETTGVKPNIYRFPGGSINDYDSTIYKEIIKEMDRRGFTYFDWNVAAPDTQPGATEKSIYGNVISEVQEHSRSIILFHDSATKNKTVESLDKIIKKLKCDGYTMDCLSNKIKPIIFNIK